MPLAHIHNHTEYSPLDGLSTCAEAAARAADIGAPALAITDHGTCAGHPNHQAACRREGIKPLFGIETYLAEAPRAQRPAEGDKEAQARLRSGTHLVLLAIDNKGLQDLWALSTASYAAESFYYTPRIDWELLERYGSHLIATTACLGGPASQLLLNGHTTEGAARLLRLKQIFGDRLYLEIQPNGQREQMQLNQLLVSAADYLKVPLVAASDAHYPSPGEAALHKIWMACQTGTGNEDYWHFDHMHGEAEMRERLAYLGPDAVGQAIRSTTEIAERCTAEISGHAEPPVFTPGGTHADDARRLLDLCLAEFDKIRPATGYTRRDYLDRLEREWRLVADKRLAGCYLIVDDVIAWTKSQGRLVGPGRGSAAGSLMSYLRHITSIDPLPAGLMFERFLTAGRTMLPDFDMDFATSWRGPVTDYVIGKYGADRVIRISTHMRYRTKGILDKLFKVLARQLPDGAESDGRQIAAIVDEEEAGTAGLGLPYDEIITAQRLQEFITRYAAVFDVAGALVNRLHAYGQHPAGLVISSDATLAGMLPMRTDRGKGPLIAQLDYRSVEDFGLLKLDFLTLRTLDTVQEAIDLIGRRTGTRPDPLSWDREHDDPQVWDAIGTGHTLGMFTIETSLGQQAARRMGPRSLAELADLTTYIRPGPRNSGMAESYLRRRAGTEEITYPHPLLAGDLEPTFGTMLYQEQILTAVRLLGGYDEAEADQVRKILGKKLKDKIEAAGKEFVDRCAERGHDPAEIEALWEKMAEFGKYAFNRAHARAYATLSYWTAWLKTHYPVEMLTAILATLKDQEKDRMPAYAMEARRLGISIEPPDARSGGASFTAGELSIRYGMRSVKGVGPAALAKIAAGQPYTSYDDFRARSGADAGVVYALAQAGALDALVPSRRGLVLALEADRSGDSVRCLHKDTSASGPNGLPCTFDWSSEPVPVRISERTGKQLKSQRKPPPKRCTIACRQYSPPQALGLEVPEYSPAELFRMDAGTYGCWMHPAPFGQMDKLGDGIREQARRIALALPSMPPGPCPLLAVLGGLSAPRLTRAGTPMWWVSLATEVSLVSAVVFSPRNDGDPDLAPVLRTMRTGTLVIAEIVKNRYQGADGSWRSSWRLAGIEPARV